MANDYYVYIGNMIKAELQERKSEAEVRGCLNCGKFSLHNFCSECGGKIGMIPDNSTFMFGPIDTEEWVEETSDYFQMEIVGKFAYIFERGKGTGIHINPEWDTQKFREIPENIISDRFNKIIEILDKHKFTYWPVYGALPYVN